mgnify:CR=1 FL=1
MQSLNKLVDKTAEEMKKAIKTKQEYGGLEKSQPKAAKIPGRALAIEGEKTLAITDGKSLVGDGDVSKQNRTELNFGNLSPITITTPTNLTDISPILIQNKPDDTLIL